METNELARVASTIITALAALLLAFMWQQNRTGKTISLWLCSGLAGIFIGGAGFFGVLHFKGYTFQKVVVINPSEAAKAMGGGMGGGMGGKGGGGMGGGAMGGKGAGGMGGGMGGKGGGMGGGFQPSPKAILAGLIRKLELLTGDVAIQLTDAQKQALIKELADLDTEVKMTDDQALKKTDAINAILSDAQKVKHQAISLPRAAGGGGGGGFGGPPPDPNANPFSETNSLKALKTFRTRL